MSVSNHYIVDQASNGTDFRSKLDLVVSIRASHSVHIIPSDYVLRLSFIILLPVNSHHAAGMFIPPHNLPRRISLYRLSPDERI